MAWPGLVIFGGNELINTERAARYAAALGITTVHCGQCSTLHRALGDLPYTSPDADDAPWYDPAVPDSKEFAGFVGLELLGLSKSVGRHDVVPLTTDGASLHPLRRVHREIQIRALALAKTDCALAYGFTWLASALRGSICGPGCVGDQLCLFTCCPPCPDPPQPPDPDPCRTAATAYWRYLLNVGLFAMDDPQPRKIAGGWVAETVFTVAAGNPFIYHEPRLLARINQLPDIIPNYDPNVSTTCVEPTDCLRDASCPPPPLPTLPPRPVDGCFPRTPFTARRAMISLPAQVVPAWPEKVPLVTVYAGGRRLERLTIRWYTNPLARDCFDAVDPCVACAEASMTFIPAGSTLTIDGRTESADVDCPGGPGLATAPAQLYGPGGSPFIWPSFLCADSACVEVIALDGTVAPDFEITISYVTREDAS